MASYYIEVINGTNLLEPQVLAQCRNLPRSDLFIKSVAFTRDTLKGTTPIGLDILVGSPGGEVSIYPNDEAKPKLNAGQGQVIQTGLNVPVESLKSIKFTAYSVPTGGGGTRITAVIELSDGASEGGASPTRDTANFTTASIAPSVTENKDVTIGKMSAAWKIETSREARVRAYQTDSYRTADAARPLGTETDAETGLLLEAVTTTGNLVLDAKQTAFLFNGDSPATGKIYFAVENRSASAGTVAVTITKLTLEN